MNEPSRVFALVLALGGLTATARADVIKVPGDYFNLQVAVNNAADGDVIMILAGEYAGPVDIDDKALTLVVEFGQASTPRIAIHDLSPGKTVILRGLGGDGVNFPLGPNVEGLLLTDNQGHVVVEGATFLGGLGRNAIRIEDSARVSIAHCTLAAGRGAAALQSAGSDVSVTFSSLTGGEANSWTYFGLDGGPGIWHGSGRLYVSGSTLVGGDGSYGSCDWTPLGGLLCGDGGNGGAGLFAYGGASVWEHGNLYLPGLGKPGGDDDGSTEPGLDGLALLLESSATATTFPSPSRDTAVTALRREGQTGTLVFDGEPDDFALVWVSLAPRWELLPAYAGVFQVDNGAGFNLLIPVATTGPTGTLTLPFVAPALAGSLDALTVHLQGVFRDSGGQYRLAPRTVLVLVDSAY